MQKFPTVAFPITLGFPDTIQELENLVEFVFGFLLEGADIIHRQSMPEIRPAEHLTMEVCENPSLPLQAQPANTTHQHSPHQHINNDVLINATEQVIVLN